MSEDMYSSAAELVKNARKLVALTGAGSSTPSGIPDFRSPGSGLWEKIDAIEVATIDSFLKTPEKFFEFLAPLAETMENAEPNPGHNILAKWEREGRLHSVITQNIDNLHQEAGSKNVLELHGNARRAYCIKCAKEYTPQQLKEKLEVSAVPMCDCEQAGIIKPDIILFGEALPYDTLMQAQEDAQSCDVLIVVGSSLTVSPASMIPQMAFQNGAKIIVVNIQRTYIDKNADVVIRDRLEEALPRIDELVSA